MPLVLLRRPAWLCGLEECEHALDVFGARRVIEDAEPERGAAVHAGGRDEPEPALLERGGEPVDRVVVTPAPEEADHAERRRCREFEHVAGLDARTCQLDKVECAIDRLAERVDAKGS